MTILKPELLQVVEEAKRRFCDPIDARQPGIRDWLVRGGNYFVVRSTKDELIVEATDNSWAFANGADLGRYFEAARESVLPRTCPSYDRRSLGWTCVAMYYTAVYLMLGVIRLFGNGLMYLTSEDRDALAVAPGSTTRLGKGTYTLTVSLGIRARIRLTRSDGAGFHETFWRYADQSLKKFAEELGSGEGISKPFVPQVRTEAILSLEDLRNWLGTPGDDGRDIGWMSALRNQIHYRLARNVWSPNYHINGVSSERLRQDITAILRGRRDRLGPQLTMDTDVRAMIERVSVLFRDVSKVSDFPQIGSP